LAYRGLVREAVASKADDVLRVAIGGANEAGYVRDVTRSAMHLRFASTFSAVIK
jgi:hypothetical protein